MPTAKTSVTKKKNSRLDVSRDDELKVLRRLVELSASDLDLEHVLHEVVGIVNDMFSADSVFIYLFEVKRKTLTLMASKTPHQEELGQVRLKAGEGITGWVARENKPVAIARNAFKDARFKNFDVLPEDKYEAFLSVPIVYKGKVSGVINIQHRKPHEYAAASVKLIENIARQVGGVIEHARLYQETKIKASQFDSLVKVSQSITSESYLDEMLNIIVLVTAEMLDSKICSIMLLDPNNNEELVMRATQSLSEDYKKKPNVRVKASIAGEAVLKKQSIAILDVRKEERYFFRDLAIKERLSSMLIVPMIVRDDVIGVITVYTKEEHHFSGEEIGVLQMVANQAAVAVENTKLMEEADKAKKALETRKLIERAKGVLMRMNNLTEDAAYRLIHKKSMDTCRSMKDIAESIILMDELRA